MAKDVLSQDGSTVKKTDIPVYRTGPPSVKFKKNKSLGIRGFTAF